MSIQNETESPLTLSQLTQFYKQTIEPRFQKIENKLSDLSCEIENLSREMMKRFDDLFKIELCHSREGEFPPSRE